MGIGIFARFIHILNFIALHYNSAVSTKKEKIFYVCFVKLGEAYVSMRACVRGICKNRNF